MRTRLCAWFAVFLTLFFISPARATTYYVSANQSWETALGKVTNTGEDIIFLRLDVAGPLDVSKSFTLNLYNRTVSSGSEYTLRNSGTLTIKTSATPPGGITNTNATGTTLVNESGATLTLESGTFSSDYQVLENAGTTVISGGTYTFNSATGGGIYV